MRTLVICEKPNAAQRVAYAISGGTQIKKTKRGAYWFECKIDGNDVVVAPAVGHLFGLTQKSKGWSYPVFDVEWSGTFIQKGAAFTKKYHDNLKEVAKTCDNFIVATDFDLEGAVIGYNILRFICGTKNAKRMKFSTLTFHELRNAYKNLKPHLDQGQVNAGLLRHTLDWYWGINTSRALMLAVKSQGRYRILSVGRVQGPALRILADREKEIQDFKPVPYWQLLLKCKEVDAGYKEKRIWDEKKAKKIKTDCQKSDAIVSKIERNSYKVQPPTPFNLMELQKEAYRCFKITPSQTLKCAQTLYSSGLISYPRTSSEQLPPSIGYRSILEKINKNEKYAESANFLLSKTSLNPRNGRKKDSAHPAIYPTGEFNYKLGVQDFKVFDLIVKRFMATFGTAAIREKMQITVKIKDYEFIAVGYRTLEEHWFRIYAPYVLLKETEFPELKEGQKLTNGKLSLLKKQTLPPNRFSAASLISELESKEIGTKSTRSEIIESLYKRNYIQDVQIKVTELGLRVSDTLKKHCPDIVSEELTRDFEDQMEAVRQNKKSLDEVIASAKKELTKMLERFKKDEKEIGAELIKSINETSRKENEVGVCPNCGKPLRIIVSKSSGKRFVGCSNFANGCRTSFPLPQKGLIRTTNQKCKVCNHPIVKVITKGRRPWMLCINPACPGKKKSK